MKKTSLAMALLALMAACVVPACYEGDVPPMKGDEAAKVEQKKAATTETPAADIETPNAAVHYKKAFNMLVYTEGPATSGAISMTMMKGWARYSTPELEQLLDANKACFEEFKKGVDIEKCDFTFGEPKIVLASASYPRNKSIWKMTCLKLANARRYEFEGRGNEAVEECLDMLKFMNHLAQGKPFLDKAIALNNEERTIAVIKDMLDKYGLNKASCAKLASDLEAFEKIRYPASSILEHEKEYFFFVLNTIANRLADGKTTEGGKEELAAAFIEKLLEAGRQEADNYFDLATKAAASDSEEDWATLEAVALELKQNAKAVIQQVFSDKDLIDLVRADMEKNGIEAAPKVAKILIAMFSSSAKGMIQYHAKNENLIKKLKERAKAGP